MNRQACETPNCKGYQDVIDKYQKICAKCYLQRRGLGIDTRRPVARSYPQPTNDHRRGERYPLNHED
jgi:hypothetical protein